MLPAAPTPSAGQKTPKPKLPENHRIWLEEDVAHIIGPTEREVFLKLESDRHRDQFIEAFWKQRDPTPGSAENEFRTEHERRLGHADRYFGRDAPRPGRRTDRGRIYIVLGEPREVQKFAGRSSTYDAEVWFYQGKTDLGLPAGFNLVFFRPGGQGEYRLYSPVGDGPQALLAGYLGGHDHEKAYGKLREVEPGLAAVSLSLIPGEDGGAYGRPSMSSDLLIRRIESAPARTVEAKYARKFLEYKDIVEVEYTANYIDSESLVKVFRDASGSWFVHYAVEPRRLSVNQAGDKYYTTLKVNGRVTTADGRLVHQFDKTVALDLTEEQMREASRAPFDFQDLFPLVDGDFSLSVLIKNEVSKEFTSVEQAVHVPKPGTAVRMTPLLLGYRAVRADPDGRGRMKAFRLGPYQVYCQPGRVFAGRETLAVAFQLEHAAGELRTGAEVKIEFLKEGQTVRAIRRKPSDHEDPVNILEEVPLADLPPAHYTVRASIASAGAELASAAEEFDLTFAESVPRPWFSSRVLPDAADPVYSEIAGAQLYNLGRYRESLRFLDKAFRMKPESEDAAANVARVHLALSDAPAAVAALTPFLGGSASVKYETFLLGAAALGKTGDCGRAVEVIDRAIAQHGTSVALLNMAGGCYMELGKAREALAAFERSLELSPDQPAVRAKVEKLRK
jgi:GWxTD domain-containing protein